MGQRNIASLAVLDKTASFGPAFARGGGQRLRLVRGSLVFVRLARNERSSGVLDAGEGSEAVVFHLENPIAVIESFADLHQRHPVEAGKHSFLHFRGTERLRHIFAYTAGVSCRICSVSFTDSTGVRHSVEVPASTLYEAAVLAIVEFRRCGFTDAVVGSGTRLSVTAAAPATTHEVVVSKLEAWLHSGGKSPIEQVLTGRLRELINAG